MNPLKLIEKSKDSPFYLWLLNLGLNRMIPFNNPHKFRIISIGERSVLVKLPFLRRNMNHIRGLHACALATLAEYSTGLVLISSLDPGSFRLIMQKISMEYHYQGKMDAYASFSISEDWLKTNILDKIKPGSPVTIPCTIDIYDSDKNKLATGNITWQIKSWNEVKTKNLPH